MKEPNQLKIKDISAMNLTDCVQKLVQNEHQMQEKHTQKANYERQYANHEAALQTLKSQINATLNNSTPPSGKNNNYIKLKNMFDDAVTHFTRANLSISDNKQNFDATLNTASRFANDLELIENFSSIINNARSNFNDILEREAKEATLKKAAQRSTFRKIIVVAVMLVIAYFLFV